MLLIILYHTDFLAGVLFSFLCADHFNPLSAELNPICHLLALLGAHHILHVSGLRVKHNGTQNFFLLLGSSLMTSVK